MSAPIAWANAVRRPRLRLPIIDGWILTAALAFFALLFIALFGARIAPHEPIYFVVEHGSDPRPYDPGIVFPFGSDILGRDILSLVLAGAGTTITIALAGGIARVAAGVVLAAVDGWWRPLRLLTESVAELVSAIPATLVALVVVRILVRADTTILVFVGALLLIGWAGPYRVVRAEIDRLQHAPFTIGARALGVSGRRVFWRHQLPHLVPVLAMNLAQQTVASLVLVAELGVLGTFVGTTRFVNIEESLTRVVTGPVNFATIADPPEWGGLLASARTIESLWTTRWLIFVPGLAFAFTAIAIALIGFALSRRYARRDITDDVRGSGPLLIAAAAIVLVVTSSVVPERYAEARTWARDARTAIADVPTDVARAFAEAGLAPIGASFAVERSAVAVVQTAGASLTLGDVSMSESWPRDPTRAQFGGDVRSFVKAGLGGGAVEAPLVFAGRGIVPSENPPPAFRTLVGLQNPDLGDLLQAYPDDYAGLDVRGKVVMLVRFFGFMHETFGPDGKPKTRRVVYGYGPEDAIANAIKRGAAAVLFVDPDLPFYTDSFVATAERSSGTPSPYARAERNDPAIEPTGVPVVVISGKAAAQLLVPLGIDPTRLYGYDDYGKFDGAASLSRQVGMRARLSVPLEKKESHAMSFVGEIPGARPDAARVLVWTVLPADGSRSRPMETLAATARALASHHAPFVFVAFDPSNEPAANKTLVVDLLRQRQIVLVLLLFDLDGDALQFTTPNGDLVPALDLYADRAGARHIVTRTTSNVFALGDAAPFADVRTVLIEGRGDEGDLREDAAALVGYLAGRYALGAEELPR